MAPEGPGVLRDLFDEVFLDFDRVGVFGQPEAFAQARDVGIDDDTRFDAVGVPKDDVGGFTSDAGEVGEGVEIYRNFAIMFPDEGFRGGNEVLGLVAEEAGGADEVFDILLLCGGKRSGVRVFFEERGRHHVDAHVGALRGQNGGNEELERAVVVQLAMGVGVGGAEDAEQLAGASVASGG